MAQTKQAIPRVALGLWFAAMVLVSSSLLARHLVPLPAVAAEDDMAGALATLRASSERDRWMTVHVLYAQCRCSQRIVDHLVDPARRNDLAEHVLLVGASRDFERRLTDAGFRVHAVTSADLKARYHVVAAPLFVLVGPEGAVRYAGGYTDRKQGPNPRDLEIVANVKAGREPDALAVYGCAVSRELDRAINPLGMP